MEELVVFYKKYSSIIVPGLLLLGALLILLQVVLPTLSMVNATREELSVEEKKLDDYNTSIDILKKTDTDRLVSQVKSANIALPSSKDVQSLYLALTKSAANANIALTGFSVTIGDVYGGSVSKPDVSVTTPTVAVSVQVAGVTLDSLLQFSNAFLATSPLSQITKAKIGGGSGSIDMVFYYKPYDLNKINKDVITPLTPNQEKILKDLPEN